LDALTNVRGLVAAALPPALLFLDKAYTTSILLLIVVDGVVSIRLHKAGARNHIVRNDRLANAKEWSI